VPQILAGSRPRAGEIPEPRPRCRAHTRLTGRRRAASAPA
jgi:hypothetical protein